MEYKEIDWEDVKFAAGTLAQHAGVICDEIRGGWITGRDLSEWERRADILIAAYEIMREEPWALARPVGEPECAEITGEPNEDSPKPTLDEIIDEAVARKRGEFDDTF